MVPIHGLYQITLVSVYRKTIHFSDMFIAEGRKIRWNIKFLQMGDVPLADTVSVQEL